MATFLGVATKGPASNTRGTIPPWPAAPRARISPSGARESGEFVGVGVRYYATRSSGPATRVRHRVGATRARGPATKGSMNPGHQHADCLERQVLSKQLYLSRLMG